MIARRGARTANGPLTQLAACASTRRGAIVRLALEPKSPAPGGASSLRRAAASHHAFAAWSGHAVFQALDPLFDAIGVANAGELAPRVEQDDDHRFSRDARL